jgi:hypothetical protein
MTLYDNGVVVSSRVRWTAVSAARERSLPRCDCSFLATVSTCVRSSVGAAHNVENFCHTSLLSSFLFSRPDFGCGKSLPLQRLLPIFSTSHPSNLSLHGPHSAALTVSPQQYVSVPSSLPSAPHNHRATVQRWFLIGTSYDKSSPFHIVCAPEARCFQRLPIPPADISRQ